MDGVLTVYHPSGAVHSVIPVRKNDLYRRGDPVVLEPDTGYYPVKYTPNGGTEFDQNSFRLSSANSSDSFSIEENTYNIRLQNQLLQGNHWLSWQSYSSGLNRGSPTPWVWIEFPTPYGDTIGPEMIVRDSSYDSETFFVKASPTAQYVTKFEIRGLLDLLSSLQPNLQIVDIGVGKSVTSSLPTFDPSRKVTITQSKPGLTRTDEFEIELVDARSVGSLRKDGVLRLGVSQSFTSASGSDVSFIGQTEVFTDVAISHQFLLTNNTIGSINYSSGFDKVDFTNLSFSGLQRLIPLDSTTLKRPAPSLV
jgi:hypothetical protein